MPERRIKRERSPSWGGKEPRASKVSPSGESSAMRDTEAKSLASMVRCRSFGRTRCCMRRDGFETAEKNKDFEVGKCDQVAVDR
jgi:hypothetical protein